LGQNNGKKSAKLIMAIPNATLFLVMPLALPHFPYNNFF
jgi:hypothetical protein